MKDLGCFIHFQQNAKKEDYKAFSRITCRLTKEDYKAFSQIMKPYLKPRAGGVRKLSWFVEGLERYIQDVNEAKHTDIYIGMEEFCGDHTWQEATIFIKEQLDQDIPVPYLLLRHQNEAYKDYIWHWFLLARIRRKRWKNVHQNSNLWGKRHLRSRRPLEHRLRRKRRPHTPYTTLQLIRQRV